jgi:hypothetical protein
MAKGFAVGYSFMYVIDKVPLRDSAAAFPIMLLCASCVSTAQFVGQDPNLVASRPFFPAYGASKVGRLLKKGSAAVKATVQPSPAAKASALASKVESKLEHTVSDVLHKVSDAAEGAKRHSPVLQREFVTTGFTGLLQPNGR